ncbi:MAG: universal stress protein [Acidobacteria bacterium]|nr:universal stress protein [Acidobacteriota bacterium]
MVEFRRILCPVDFSAASVRAFAHAAALARWYDAQMTVLHVVPTFDSMSVRGGLGDPVHVVTPTSREQVLAEMNRSLNMAAAPPRATSVAEAGDPQTTIIDQAVSKGADLIVMGTHGRRGFKRLVLGSVTEAVLREAPCPVLTVPQQAPADIAEAVTFKRILCPMDFSPSSLQALGFALDLARQADGLVTLLHVVEWLAEEEPQAAVHFDFLGYRRRMVEEAQQRLRALVAGESRTWIGIDDMVVSGRAHREVLRAAEATSADLIVMGAQGRGGIGLALFGSTTQQVVRGATCPVLTVRGLRQ